MKKKFGLLVALVCLASIGLFSSCTKSNEELIIGTWRMTNASANGYTVGSIWTFAENGNFYYVAEGYNETGTYWLSGNSLTVVMDEEPTYFTIVELNKKNMSLSFKESGGNGHYYDVQFNFSRQ